MFWRNALAFLNHKNGCFHGLFSVINIFRFTKMEAAKLIVDLIGKLIWPIVLIIIIWKFRKQIAIRLKDVNEIELPGGFKAKLEKAIDARIEKLDLIEDLEVQIEKEQVNKIEPNKKVQQNQTLLAFTANTTREENLQYDIYYDPETRKHNILFKYIGLYAEKSIFAIGKLNKIAHCDYDEGRLIGRDGYDLNQLSEDEYERIKGIIENTDYYDIKRGVKFFLVDKFYITDYIKISDYPIRAKKYIWLDKVKGFEDNMTVPQIAKLLDGKEWE